MLPTDIWASEIILALLVLAYVVSGIDDLSIDIYYWVKYFRHRIKYPRDRFPLLTLDDLNSVPQKKAAIFVAAWHEEDVIDKMVIHNTPLIDYLNYDFFIGTYPNDLATQAKVDMVSRHLPVYKAVTPHPGPTNKADNINSIFAEMVRQEQKSGERYDFILMHDPEDVLHPLELKLCNYLISRKGVHMVQTPVFPLEVPPHYFTAGSYIDEFAETHTKDMYVREWIGGFVPSAGVGTAIARNAFERLAAQFGENLFNHETLTEDYDFSLRLKLSGLKAIFVRQPLLRCQIQVGGRSNDGILVKYVKEFIATRARFPHTFKTAVRQRTRWSLGIIFQGWKNIGWQGNLQTKWLLFHDRKGVWANTVVLFSYLFAFYLIAHDILREYLWPAALGPALPDHQWIKWATVVCTAMMLNRILQRVIATTRIYGIRQGLLSVARLLWGNVINGAATLRAFYQFVSAEKSGRRIAWDKTKHYFPSPAEISTYKQGLGELLPENRQLTLEQIEAAGGEQFKEQLTGKESATT